MTKPSPCCYQGRCRHWIAFEKRMVIAHCRARLMLAAELVHDDLTRQKLPTDSDTLAIKMMERVNNARPRSLYVPLGVTPAELDALIMVVVKDVERAEAGHAKRNQR